MYKDAYAIHPLCTHVGPEALCIYVYTLYIHYALMVHVHVDIIYVHWIDKVTLCPLLHTVFYNDEMLKTAKH